MKLINKFNNRNHNYIILFVIQFVRSIYKFLFTVVVKTSIETQLVSVPKSGDLVPFLPYMLAETCAVYIPTFRKAPPIEHIIHKVCYLVVHCFIRSNALKFGRPIVIRQTPRKASRGSLNRRYAFPHTLTCQHIRASLTQASTHGE